MKAGLPVRSLRDFSGVPKGTLGFVGKLDYHGKYSSHGYFRPNYKHPHYPVSWVRKGKPALTNWFSPDEEEYLEPA